MAKAKTGKVRSTIFIEPALVGDLDFMARTEALKQNASISRTDIINLAIQEYKAKWEKKNGTIPVK